MLQEEQRRVLISLEKTAEVWDTKANKMPHTDDPYIEGLRAYAAKQATIQRGLKAKFSAMWDKAEFTPIQVALSMDPTIDRDGNEDLETTVEEDDVEIDLGSGDDSEDDWGTEEESDLE